MKLKILLLSVAILLTACAGKDYGAYYTFGNGDDDLFATTYLVSKFDCTVEELEEIAIYKVICINKNDGAVRNMYVTYYEYGEHYILR